MQPQELMEIGLTKHQAEVFIEIMKHAGQSGGGIAKACGIDRSFAYGVINSLISKGLVSYVTKGKVRQYYTSDPENLLQDIEEKKSKVEAIVSELKAIKKQERPEQSVRVYEGKAGLKAFVRDVLQSGVIDTLGGGGGLEIFDALKYERPHYISQLKRKKICGRLITSRKNKQLLSGTYKGSQMQMRTFENLKDGVSFTIFDNKLAIYSAEEKPYVIIIDNKGIASSLRAYFENMWRYARQD